MPRINYFNIETQIKAVLDADSNLTGTAVLVEEEIAVQRGNVIGIYLDDRSAPSELQSISSGTRTRFFVQFSIWCWHFGIGRDRSPAMQARDDLVGKVEIALMGNRTLNATVNTSWLEGGEFISGPDPTGDQFMSGAQVRLTVDVTASI